MEKQTITIYDVAREANVSMATVSRVVNGNPNVKPATRKKVLEVATRTKSQDGGAGGTLVKNHGPYHQQRGHHYQGGRTYQCHKGMLH